MTGFTTDGVYNVRNVGRDLMLDLLGNNPFEGATIQGWGRNGTQAQEWIIRAQSPGGSSVGSARTVSIQCDNSDALGNGFFAAGTQDADEVVLYTRKAWVVDLVPGTDDTYSIRYTVGNPELVLAIPSETQGEVELANINLDDARQQWEFTRIRDF